MKKKKISLKLVTLVMSGTLLATPMVSSAEEVGNNSTTISTNTSESTEGTGSTVVTDPETPVDSSTTLPNNVDTVIPDDETKGTEINSSIWGRHIEYDPDLGIEAAPVGPGHTEIKVNISPEESKGEETLSPTFGSAFFYPDTADNHPSRDVADDLRT